MKVGDKVWITSIKGNKNIIKQTTIEYIKELNGKPLYCNDSPDGWMYKRKNQLFKTRKTLKIKLKIHRYRNR